MKTLIELYDDRPLENILSTEVFRPERTVYICSREVARSGVKKKKLKEFGFILTLRENYGLLKAYLAKRAGKKNEYDTVSYHLRMAKLSWVPEKEIIAIMERFRGLM